MKKMYIAILDEFPDYMTPTLVGHAVLGFHLKVQINITDSFWSEYDNWLFNSFKKVVVRVNQKEFTKILNEIPNSFDFCENNTLDGKPSCVVTVIDSDNIPNVLKYAKLWKPKVNSSVV